MNISFSSSLRRRLQWFNLPTAVLMALLQRTPVVRVLAAFEEMVISSPVSSILKSVATAAASLGAINSMAGATPLVPSSGTASGITVTQGVSVSVAYTANSPLGPGTSWDTAGTIPPGLSFNGQTGSTLSLTGTPTTTGVFPITIKAFGPNGEEVDYAYTITVAAGGGGTAPAFSTQPSSQSVSVGANVTFTVAVTGTPPPTIQWKKGGVDIVGQTGLSLTLNNVQLVDNGTIYTAVATNSAGNATSTGATLTVNAALAAPAFTTHPASQSVAPSANVTFTVVVTGNPTPTIQWKKGGVDIAGQTGLSLTLNSVQLSDSGSVYTAVATNSQGTATSNGATLTVTAAAVAPSFTTQPTNQTVTSGGNATFTVAVSGNPTPTIQWKKGGVDIVGQTALTLTLNSVQVSDSGTSYTAVATNSAGSATSTAATLTVNASTLPAVTTQPVGHTIATGSVVVFNSVFSGGGLTYQWKKGGVNVAGATSAQLVITNSQASDAGSYTVTATNGSGSATSTAAVLAVATSSDPGRLINASVRIISGSDANVLIMGFVLGGQGTSGSKTVLIRGVGPTLTGFGVPGAMVDPVLDIIPGGGSTPLVSNDDWAGNATVTSTGNSVGAFPLPSTTSKDSALVTTLASGVYSAKVSGKANTTGTVLAEMYDGNPSVYSPTGARIVNLSARVGSENTNPLITGFVLGGSTARTLMIRAIGPTLTAFGVPGAMSDPQLELYQAVGATNTLLLTNDNWGGSAQITTTGNSVGAFALTDTASKDAVILVTLDPGIYSAKVLGVNNVSGIALVELYEIP